MRTDGVITPTRVELGSRCYRRHAISDVLEKGLYKSPSAGFGNVIHAGAAAHWLRSYRGEQVDPIERATAEFRRVEQDMNDKHSLELALAMLDVYQQQASLAGPLSAADYHIVTIEERLETEIGGYTLSFQLDRLLANNNQERLLLLDTKSAARLDQRWRSGWDRSLQFKLYKAAIQRVYEMPVDIIIEGVLKTPKSKIEYYLVPDWDDSQLDEAISQMCFIAEKDRKLLNILTSTDESTMIEYVLTQTSFNPQDCHSYNTDCPFLKLCDSPLEIRRGLLESEYITIAGDY
jgi:hypothetical protein